MPSFFIHVLNVGHGDSIILELPDGNWGIVDCFKTKEDKEPPALTFLIKRKVKKLKFVCLTHPHYDHYHGMLELLKYFSSGGRKIECFWDFGIDKAKLEHFKEKLGHEEYTELRSLHKKVIEDKRIEYQDLGLRTDCLKIDSLEIKSYAPIPRDTLRYFQKWGKNKKVDENLLSVVLVIKYGTTNVVLGADTSSWEKILEAWKKDCRQAKRRRRHKFDFIKVSHHGLSEGNYDKLWKSFTVRGKSIAVISTGCKYASPSDETVRSIVSRKVKLYSTNYRVFLEPVPLEEYEKKGFISHSQLEALEASTLPVEDFRIRVPYHGNCSITVKDNGECSVLPEIPRLPIS